MKRFFKHFDEIPPIEEITGPKSYVQAGDGTCHHATHKPIDCPYKGPTNPSEYYRQKQDEAEAWTKLRDYALVKMMPSTVLRQLERHIEAARFVGD